MTGGEAAGSSPRPCIRSFYHPYLLLAILWLCVMACSAVCQVERCSTYYHPKEDGPQLCSELRKYLNCIREQARPCRGNLNYHTLDKIVMKWVNQSSCSKMPPVLPAATRPPDTSSSESNIKCQYPNVTEYRHCGLFGDPHLKTFSGEYQTCQVKGAWPLIENAYLAVQATNERVTSGSSATATTKVTVIIKGHTPCSPEKTYEAQADTLPPTFIDGTQAAGPDKSVRLFVQKAGSHVEITIRHVATTIILRRNGNYLAFAVRMPREVAEQGLVRDELQLCTRGCPRGEKLDYHQTLAAAAGHREMALRQCRALDLTDHYLDWCVFDVLTTGDPSFSEAAKAAQIDVYQLDPESAAALPNRTQLPPPITVESESSSAVCGPVILPVLVLLVLCSLVTR